MPLYSIKGFKVFQNKCLIQKNNNTINKQIISNHINISTTNRLFGKNPASARSVYSKQEPYNSVNGFIRNPNCWINGVSNISCFSPAQLSGYDWWKTAGTLITRKHAIFANHFKPQIVGTGTPLIFIDDNNNYIFRRIIQYIADTGHTDISIGLLDSEVPSNIKIAKVLPKNFQNYIFTYKFAPNINQDKVDAFYPYLYCVSLDQQEKALLKIFISLVSQDSMVDPIFGRYQYTSAVGEPIDFQSMQYQYSGLTPAPSQFSDWTETIVSGDSGNPTFLIIDNELVLLYCFLSPDNGPFVTGRYDKINSMIETLSPGQGYSLTPIDLDAVYNKYS